MAFATWLQRLSGITLESRLLGVDPTGREEPCPQCRIAQLQPIRGQREVRLFGLRLWSGPLAGLACPGCGGHFLRQSGASRWADVVLMAPFLAFIFFPAAAAPGWWLGKALWELIHGNAAASDVAVAAAMFAAGFLIFFIPARSFVRRVRIAWRGGLTWMDPTFSASR